MRVAGRSRHAHNGDDGKEMSSERGQYNDVYMTRHSARADNDEWRTWTPLPGRMPDDTECSNDGEEASQELADKFDSIELRHIVSSPFYRCLQTVAPIAERKGLLIKVEPGVCEILSTFPPGFWDTAKLANETDLPIDTSYRPALERQQLSREFGDGQAAERSRRVALKIAKNLNDDGPILFCGHGASCLGIAQAFGGDGYVGYSSFSHFKAKKNEPNNWNCLSWGDVSHLSEKHQKRSLQSAW